MTYRVCDYIADELYRRGVRHIYGLMGGGASGLNDGFIKHGKLKYISFHNEQGAGHAAVGESKFTGNISVVNPTTGCGGTNCITSLLGAWQDSIPVIFISGNVGTEQCSRWINRYKSVNLRKYGIQEHDIISTVSSMTKYSSFIDNENNIAYELDKAIHISKIERPGPVWLDIPSNIQVAEMPKVLRRYTYYDYITNDINLKLVSNHDKYEIISLFNKSEKPIVLAGQGIKQSKTINQFLKFIEKFKIPYVSTYGARDLLPYDHELNIGAIGIKGSRAGNFAMQSADLLFILGCSLNNSHTGYDLNSWAPNAKKIFVTNDKSEYLKFSKSNYENNKLYIKFDYTLDCDLTDFFRVINE